MPSPVTIFARILESLQAAIAHRMVRDRIRAPLLLLLHAYISRTIERVATLHARWRAGTLPRPRTGRIPPAPPTQPEPPSHQAAPIPTRARLPATRAWIVHVVGFQAANFASQLAHLLTHPDLADFLAQAPQAGRLLRPICRMLGTEIPQVLILPPPPPRPPKPRPPQPEPAPPPRHGKYTPAAIRRYRPGPIPPFPQRPPGQPPPDATPTTSILLR